MFDSLRSWFTEPTRAAKAQDLRAGPAVVTGVVKATGATVESALGGQPVVAFGYRSTWRAPGRGGTVTRVFQEAQVYCERFGLDLEGGSVTVVPTHSDAFGHADHQAAAASKLPGFEAKEQVLRPGDRVEVHGTLREEGGGWVLASTRVELKAQARQVTGNRAERRRRA